MWVKRRRITWNDVAWKERKRSEGRRSLGYILEVLKLSFWWSIPRGIMGLVVFKSCHYLLTNYRHSSALCVWEEDNPNSKAFINLLRFVLCFFKTFYCSF